MPIPYRALFFALCFAPALPAMASDSEETEDSGDDWRSRLTVGIGLGAITAPDYRGSKSYRHYVAPLPYVIYRGEVIRSDRDGMRGDFWRTDQLEVSLSFAASVTPDSDENELREGMPGLDSTFELGPAVNINLSGESLSEGWMLRLPARAVIAVGHNSPEHIGWQFAPQVLYRYHRNDWNWTWRAGPAFASDDFHDYYYEVEPEYALADRPAYDPAGGYNGLNSQFSLSRREGRFWYAFYLRYYDINGTGFTDSPLVETRQGASGGFAVSWILF